jgi:glycosyltransferase involved in cell wall biosynthesis
MKLSVLTPSFQYAQFIDDAIRSVIHQPGSAIEHVVHDGASADGTVEILKGFGERVSWASESDLGQSDALNKAFARSTGEWIGWLNADEFYFPQGLDRLMEVGRESHADVVFGDAVFVDEEGRFMRLLPQHRFSRWILRSYGPFVSSCAALFRRGALCSSPWRVGLERIMDWDLYLALADQGAKFVYVPWPVGAFRVHDARITAQPADEHREHHAEVKRRYGLPGKPMSHVGEWGHGAAKLIARSYRRQFSAEPLRGVDMRWFRSDVGRDSFVRLLELSYGATYSESRL